jgi:hypothetical protein
MVFAYFQFCRLQYNHRMMQRAWCRWAQHLQMCKTKDMQVFEIKIYKYKEQNCWSKNRGFERGITGFSWVRGVSSLESCKSAKILYITPAWTHRYDIGLKRCYFRSSCRAIGRLHERMKLAHINSKNERYLNKATQKLFLIRQWTIQIPLHDAR